MTPVDKKETSHGQEQAQKTTTAPATETGPSIRPKGKADAQGQVGANRLHASQENTSEMMPVDDEFAGLLARTREALRRLKAGLGAMRIPADPADGDLVLSEWLDAAPRVHNEAIAQRDEARARLGSLEATLLEERPLLVAYEREHKSLHAEIAGLTAALASAQRERDAARAELGHIRDQVAASVRAVTK